MKASATTQTTIAFTITLAIVISCAFAAEYFLKEYYRNSIGVIIVVFGSYLLYKPARAFVSRRFNQ